MKRVDLRHLKGEFLSALGQQIKASEPGEVVIFLFEIGDYSGVTKAVNFGL
ncbi:NADH-ubiquinone oxidoreductase subunit E family protein [Campylobacter concisus]